MREEGCEKMLRERRCYMTSNTEIKQGNVGALASFDTLGETKTTFHIKI